ncbi:MAG: hypothetical protein IKE78_04665 [Erysipelotrichaceae bacterium]|nr:hypothetical protein [Erysipelotrichaceae bacterium]
MKILLGILLSITAAFSLIQIDLSSELKSDGFVLKEYEHKTSHGSGEKITVTTSYSWLSENDDDYMYIIDEPETREERYVVDSPKKEYKSHYETIHHNETGHYEQINTPITVYDVSYMMSGETYTETFGTYEEALEFMGSHDGLGIEERTEYQISQQYVVDHQAYDETVEVVDQYAADEVGHYEMIIIPEVGHLELKEGIIEGKGSGTYTAVINRETE